MVPNIVNGDSTATKSCRQGAEEAESTSPSLSTTVCGVPFPKGCLLNSSNPFATSIDDLQSLADSPATGAFATRTACPNFVHDDALHQWQEWGSSNTINCLGYSCHSFEYYVDAIQKVQATTGKPAFFSISGYAHEVAEMVQQVQTAFAATEEGTTTAPIFVELNLSCPNIPGKPPIAYDFVGLKDYLTTALAPATATPFPNHIKVGAKLTPYFYDGQFVEAATVLNSFYPQLSFLTSINTVGCGLVIDIDTEAPVVPAGFGGLGGPAVHATALGNVRRLRQVIRPEMDIIGCGGVDSGAAAFRHLLCGASAVMMASSLLVGGVEALERVEAELKEIMVQKGYSSIDDFRGKLKDGEAGGSVCPSKRS